MALAPHPSPAKTQKEEERDISPQEGGKVLLADLVSDEEGHVLLDRLRGPLPQIAGIDLEGRVMQGP